MVLTTGEKIGLASIFLVTLGMTGAIFYFLFFSWLPEPAEIYLQIKIIYMTLWVFFIVIMILFFTRAPSEPEEQKKEAKKK